MKRWQKALIWVLVIALIAGGVTWIILAQRNRRAEPPPLVKAERGAIARTLSLAGSIAVLNQVNVTARSVGKVSVILVDPGQQVNEGDELIRLASPELEDQVSIARVNLESAQLRLQQLQDGLSSADLVPLKIALDKAATDLATAKDAKLRAEETISLTASTAQQAVATAQRRFKEAQDNRLLSQQSLDLAVQAAEDAVTNAAKDLVTAQDDLKEAQRQKENAPNDAAELAADQAVKATERAVTMGERVLEGSRQKLEGQKLTRDQQLALADSQIKAAQDAITQAEQAQEQRQLANRDARIQADNAVKLTEYALQAAQANYDKATAAPSPTTLSLAEKAVETAQLTLNALLRQQTDTVILAPVKGTVGAVNVKVGDTLTPALPVIVLVDAQSLEVQVNVPEVNVGQLQVGMESSVTVDAYRGRIFNAALDSINPLATVIQGVVSYTAHFTLDPEGVLLLKPGMSAEAEVVVAESKDALIIPRSAMRMLNGSYTVELWNGEKMVTTVIEPGILTDTEVEVKSGLKEGDQVALSASGNLSTFDLTNFGMPTTSAPK